MASKSPKKNPATPPPWEIILDLLSPSLDPTTLATASCVSKSWNTTLTSDHIWKPLCLSYYPSSLHLLDDGAAANPRAIFALLQASSKRRHRKPPAPRITLCDLIFTVDVFFSDGMIPLLSMAKSGEDLQHGTGVFRFDIDVEEEITVAGGGEEWRVVWNVVMRGWRGAFSVMDRTGKGRLVGGDVLWFSEELPGPACCGLSSAVEVVGSGRRGSVVGELGLGLDEGKRVEKVSLGLMSVGEWRYVKMEDAMLYLQPFLLQM